jgi:hypothetical protein
MKKEVQDITNTIDRQNIEEDAMMEREYINDNLQLIQKEIEPHSKDFFEIISRDLQQGNIKEGGMMYLVTLESYHRALTYTKGLKQKLTKTKKDKYRIVDPKFDLKSIDWSDEDSVKTIPIIEVEKEIVKAVPKIVNTYRDNKTGKYIDVEEELEHIAFLKEHLLDSPLERGSHFVVVSNSVDGFLRKNRRTIAREVNAKSTDTLEQGKPIIMKNNRSDYFNSGGSW